VIVVSKDIILEELQGKYGEAILEVSEPYNLLTLIITKDKIKNVLEHMFEHKQWQLNFLTDLTAIHFPDLIDNEFCVVYHLHSLVNNFRIRLKVFIPLSNPEIDSATSIWEAANWMERETYDFFGIIFKGHPNLVKILNVDEQDYFPMRREYPLEDQTRRDKDDAMFGR